MQVSHLASHVVRDFGWNKHRGKNLKKKIKKKKKSKNNIDFQPPKNVSEQKQLSEIRF